MTDLFSNLKSTVFGVMFLSGYFPVNMILAFIYGDKSDLAISFLVPFYGLFVAFF
jgi:hypothetical protein